MRYQLQLEWVSNWSTSWTMHRFTIPVAERAMTIIDLAAEVSGKDLPPPSYKTLLSISEGFKEALLAENTFMIYLVIK